MFIYYNGTRNKIAGSDPKIRNFTFILFYSFLSKRIYDTVVQKKSDRCTVPSFPCQRARLNTCCIVTSLYSTHKYYHLDLFTFIIDNTRPSNKSRRFGFFLPKDMLECKDTPQNGRKQETILNNANNQIGPPWMRN